MSTPKENLERRELEEKRYKMNSVFNWGNLIALVIAIASAFMWVSKAESTFAVHTVEIAAIRIETDRERMLNARDRAEIMAQLQEINRKLDRLK